MWKAVETRARRHQLLEPANQQPAFEQWTDADLERIFWDVWVWVRAISRKHPNAPLVFALEDRFAAEYTRRHEDTPMLAEQR